MAENKLKMQGEEINLKSVVLQVRLLLAYLASKWYLIGLAALLGGGAGLWYALRQPLRYEAKLTFVVEETKSAGGGLASLAGQFGFDLGSSGGGGIFNGENVLLFLKSSKLVRETLLTPITSGSVLADEYVRSYEYKKNWTEDENIGNVLFSGKSAEQLSRKEDSLLQVITDGIIKSELQVGRPDKKASFVEVKVSMRDERLSKVFCDRLVALALERYTSSKIKVKAANVRMLQHRADSLEGLLNARTVSVAVNQQSLLDVNPGLRAATAPAEIRTRDKMTATAIYTEVVKNLEIAKAILGQETPTIEVVDQSSYPLRKQKVSLVNTMVMLSVFSAFLMIVFLVIRRWWVRQMA